MEPLLIGLLVMAAINLVWGVFNTWYANNLITMRARLVADYDELWKLIDEVKATQDQLEVKG